MRFLILSCSCLALVGCMLGPNFQRPTPPSVKQYTENTLPIKTVSSAPLKNQGNAQYFVAGRDVPLEWWRLFHSKPLNDLICLGLANNPTLEAAKSALRQAKETYQAQFGTLLIPAVDGQFSGQRERQNNRGFGSTTAGTSEFNLFNTHLNVSYVLDVFGSARRQLESTLAEVNYQEFQLEAARLNITANIVTTALNIASIEAQLSALKKIIRSQESALSIVNKQIKLGAVSGIDVALQQTEVEQTRALLPPLQQSLAKSRHALAVLVGKTPAEIPLPTFDLNRFTLPTTLPLSLPSSLVCQRPDIRAQEALLHAASAQIGVATANLFPNVSLSGNYGWSSDKLSNLFSPSNIVWNYGSAILQPIFRGGARLAERRAAIAAYEQSAALYRQTVLQSFQNVADTLEALKQDAYSLQAQSKAETAASKTLSITQKQFSLGGVSYLSLLNAERQYQQATINRIQAQAARLMDTAALYQALGGGWWNCGSRPQTVITTISFRRLT